MTSSKPTYILPAVAIIIFNANNEVLLQRRRDTNKWCIICGHVEYGETVENAALREIKEETGCKAEIVRLIGIYSNPLFETYFYSDKNVQYVTSYFEAKLTAELNFLFSNEETLELKFFDQDSLPDNMSTQIDEHWLEDALSKQDSAFIR
ncbi:MAG: NUDIX domain-containing protein [Prevotellaceae bacterium]|jgi:8-oxo-dGTP pyrophosphatase MutT (NUDIX family)|nr:NUDIX domain-containing protein [Prevotellaceae bacterium]